MKRVSLLVSLFGLFGVMACGPARAQGPAQRSPTPGSTDGVVRAETVARGLEHPWGLTFLPDGRMLVTERPGRLRIVEMNGTVSAPLSGVPAVHAVGQGGLLDVTLDPNFAQNRTIYLSFAEPGPGGTAGTAAEAVDEYRTHARGGDDRLPPRGPRLERVGGRGDGTVRG